MCMLIHHPANAEPFTREEFEDFHARSPHGFGAMWRTPLGELHSRKGLMRSGESWQLYRSLIANGCPEMVLHWRYRTAGPVNEANCHPIEVPGTRVLMMHNGAMIGPSTSTKSDSVVFAESVMPDVIRAGDWSVRHPEMTPYLERQFGGNRLILWDQDEATPVIVGEDTGLWWKGRWMSNTYAWTVPNEAMPRREPKFDWHRYA